ncbi:20294_t:CDS:1, partial [Racocetra persica]
IPPPGSTSLYQKVGMIVHIYLGYLTRCSASPLHRTHPVTESEEPSKKLPRLLTEEYRAHPLPNASPKGHKSHHTDLLERIRPM